MPQLNQNCVAEDGTRGSGSLFAMGLNYSLIGIFYNRELAEQIGITEPLETLAEFEELLAAASELDSSRSCSGAAQSLTVLVWDVAIGEPYRRYTGSPNPVDALDLSADGRTLLAGSYSGSAWLWRVDNLTELINWTHANCYVPELTGEQRELYRLEPLYGAIPTSGTIGSG